MKEKINVKSECHVRIHDRNGFVMSLDLNKNASDVITHLMKLYNGDI